MTEPTDKPFEAARIYHAMGMRDMMAGLLAEIRRSGIHGALSKYLNDFAESNPENPHIAPVRELLGRGAER